MKKVITYGTFDTLHHGHINILRRAKKLGDYLIVGLSTNKFNKIKHKKSVYSYKQRKAILEGIKYVDLVIPENSWNQKINDIKTHKIDIFVMGGDWKGKFDFLKKYCKVVILPRTKGISTTSIKNKLKKKNRKILSDISL
ncbi:glycerol-3-phosphate cytidylyltransferase [Candidatus Woesearchaeota archaeon]|nr:glycerol-3-phosphate cytidylyltransferase [Candidatus Woesearchaeota archaeon]